jgi:hypothetical protein
VHRLPVLHLGFHRDAAQEEQYQRKISQTIFHIFFFFVNLDAKLQKKMFLRAIFSNKKH